MGAQVALWSPEQQAWLAAMGLGVYHDAAQVDWPPAPAATAAVAQVAFDNVPASVRQPLPGPRPAASVPAPPVFVAQTAPPASAAVAVAPRRGGGSGLLASLPDRLMLALLRASALNPSDPQAQAVMRGWELERLRADPAAKRALWPQLRALRKQRQGR